MEIKALLVAVSVYDKYSNLPCYNDLYAMKHALTHGLNVPEESMLILGERGIVYRKDFVNALSEFCKESADVSIFYFSGHGGSGQIAFTDESVPLQLVIECIKSSRQNNKIVILDCCEAGNFLLMDEDNLDKDLSNFKETNCAVLASCRKEETSGFNENKVSLYTCLLYTSDAADEL